MKLIGMYDSPFVRPVAISMKLYGMPYEHLNWSVGKDFDQIRRHNPLGRVPTLVLDDGEALMETSAILDYLDERAGAERALLPKSGRERRTALRLIAIGTGATEKGRDQMYERIYRPQEKWHEPWLDRCRMQMHAALAELERYVVQNGATPWLVGGRMTRADIQVTCFFTLLTDSLAAEFKPVDYPALRAFVARCEALPEFVATRQKWSMPAY
ncbi:MAG TPA: glutathione S-transferase family protein [Steroidobacteraceae bacterium]